MNYIKEHKNGEAIIFSVVIFLFIRGRRAKALMKILVKTGDFDEIDAIGKKLGINANRVNESFFEIKHKFYPQDKKLLRPKRPLAS